VEHDAAVLAAVILLPTGLWPQPETLSTAWWWPIGTASADVG
jgi:hypothetical protein